MINYYSSGEVSDVQFSIIIPTWNNYEYVKICVESIRKNSTYPHQIVLHINEGSDGTVDWAKKEKLDFSHSPENIGICKACNAAYSLTRAEYVVYMNDDMYACPEWDKNLLTAIKDYGKKDFYFSATMIEWKDMGSSCVATPTNFGTSPETFQEKELLSSYQTLYRADWQGSSWPPSIMHRTLWDLVGGFSIEFSPGMYSDPDLSMKLWQAGCRNYRGIGNSLVYHFMSKSTLRVKKNNGRKQFLHKWGIGASLFYRSYIKMGGMYAGILLEPEHTLSFRLQKMKATVKYHLGL